MGDYLDSINRKNAIEAAKKMSPEGLKKQATQEIDAMKAAGLVGQDGKYRQNFVGSGAAKYFDRLTEASKTGKLLMNHPGGGGGGGGGGNYSAGGVEGGSGGSGGGSGSFAGPLTNSQPQSGSPTGGFMGGGGRQPGRGSSGAVQAEVQGSGIRAGSGYDNPGYRGESAPPPIAFTPSRIKEQRLKR
jgi:hypothetical protein